MSKHHDTIDTARRARPATKSGSPEAAPSRLSRRAFLKGATLAGAGAALTAGPIVAGSAAARAAVAEPAGSPAAIPPAPGQELATLLDLSRCIGCGACVEACHEANGHKYPEPKKPFPKMHPARVKVEDWSEKRDVDDRLTPYNWLYIQSATVTWNGEEREVHVPRRCLHCVNPPCADLCPWGAARKEGNGVVRIDADICLGGAKCRAVCPWHIPQRQTGVGLYLDILPSLAGNGVMYKCDRCHDRLAQGELPACIEACPMEVQSIGPRDEMLGRALELAASMNGYVYGAEENGGTNTFYVSPVPFELLDAAVEKGPGKPHLAPVAHALATEEVLAKAVFLAPVAGLVAGVRKALKSLREDSGGAKPANSQDDAAKPATGADKEERHD
jgi:Fe-S-cluster-containing dehydrogenase component